MLNSFVIVFIIYTILFIKASKFDSFIYLAHNCIKISEAKPLDNITPNYDYTLMQNALIANEDAVLGSMFVKKKGRLYLPHPSSVDKTSTEATERYLAYLAGAEFDDIPNSTLRAWVGKLKLDNTAIELPQRLEYLIQDVDGDGLSITGLMSCLASSVFAYKWHVLVADYQGLTDLDLEQTSIADLEAINPRATVKQYERKNVIDWSFSRINGKMQLSMILLREIGDDDYKLTDTKVESYVKLVLDENGQYYQQKLVRNSSNGGTTEGEPNYPLVGGKPLNWLPVEIVSDEETVSGQMPLRLGMLTAAIELTYNRYRASADYKEFLSKLVPTTHITGVTDTDWQSFEQINGRSYVAQGGVNIWPNENAKIEIISPNGDLEQYRSYFADNEKKIRAVGGVFPSDEKKDRTATEVLSESEMDMARLSPVVNSIEAGLKRIIAYCGMFEGIYSPDNIEQNLDEIIIDMPRDFATSKLSVNEVKALGELVLTGLYPKDEFAKMLVKGGWTVSDVDNLLNALQSSNI